MCVCVCVCVCRIVLRNHIAQKAIEMAEQGDYSEVGWSVGVYAHRQKHGLPSAGRLGESG